MRLMDAVEQLGRDYLANSRGVFAASLKRGDADFNLVVGKSLAPSTDRPIEVKGDEVTFVGTSGDVDRENDIITAAGVSHDNWLTRPVMLANHDVEQRIGIGTKVRLDGNQWIIKGDYYPAKISALAGELKAMLDYNLARKALNDAGAVFSIGFRAVKAAWNDARGGVDFARTETLEYSDVSLAANPSARLLEAKSDGLCLDATLNWAERLRVEGSSFGQRLIELCDPSKKLTLVELTVKHLDRLEISPDAEPMEIPAVIETQTLLEDDGVDPAAFAFMAGSLKLDAATTKRFMVTAGMGEFGRNIEDVAPSTTLKTAGESPAPQASLAASETGNGDGDAAARAAAIKAYAEEVANGPEAKALYTEHFVATNGWIPKETPKE